MQGPGILGGNPNPTPSSVAVTLSAKLFPACPNDHSVNPGSETFKLPPPRQSLILQQISQHWLFSFSRMKASF